MKTSSDDARIDGFADDPSQLGRQNVATRRRRPLHLWQWNPQAEEWHDLGECAEHLHYRGEYLLTIREDDWIDGFVRHLESACRPDD